MSSPAGRRLSRFARIVVPVAILAIILGAVSTVGFVQLSSQPGFCKSCHIMRPYYDSWTTSSHRKVPCIQCHIAPGIKAEAMTKVQAANMVVKYFTGAYGTRPWADIDDAACLRSGCHSERLIEGEVEFKGVRFDHTHHLGELRRGSSCAAPAATRRSSRAATSRSPRRPVSSAISRTARRGSRWPAAPAAIRRPDGSPRPKGSRSITIST